MIPDGLMDPLSRCGNTAQELEAAFFGIIRNEARVFIAFNARRYHSVRFPPSFFFHFKYYYLKKSIY
jgi:hypothetical protein